MSPRWDRVATTCLLGCLACTMPAFAAIDKQTTKPTAAPRNGGDTERETSAGTPAGVVVWDDQKRERVDRWLRETDLNYYGDARDTAYTGGTPLFNETTGQRTDRYDYVLQRRPEIRAYLDREDDFIWTDAKRQRVERWIQTHELNEFGDPRDTAYLDNSPLVTDANGQRTDRYDYVLNSHPEMRYYLDTPRELTRQQQDRLDRWLRLKQYNQYGDPTGTAYDNSPLYNASNAEYERWENRYEYVIRKHPESAAFLNWDSLDRQERSFIDDWTRQQNLNQFGEPQDQRYATGDPLYDDFTGERIDRYDYILSRHPQLAMGLYDLNKEQSDEMPWMLRQTWQPMGSMGGIQDQTFKTSLPPSRSVGIITHDSGNRNEVTVDGKRVFEFRVSAGGYSPAERWAIFQRRYTDAEGAKPILVPEDVAVRTDNGLPVIYLNNTELVTVTEADAVANDMSAEQLAQVWARNLRSALQRRAQ